MLYSKGSRSLEISPWGGMPPVKNHWARLESLLKMVKEWFQTSLAAVLSLEGKPCGNPLKDDLVKAIVFSRNVREMTHTFCVFYFSWIKCGMSSFRLLWILPLSHLPECRVTSPNRDLPAGSMCVGWILSRQGSPGDFYKVFPGVPKSGEIRFFPLKTRKSFFCWKFQHSGDPLPPFRRPWLILRLQNLDNNCHRRSRHPEDCHSCTLSSAFIAIKVTSIS